MTTGGIYQVVIPHGTRLGTLLHLLPFKGDWHVTRNLHWKSAWAQKMHAAFNPAKGNLFSVPSLSTAPP